MSRPTSVFSARLELSAELARTRPRFISIVAPAGYGKTTIAQRYAAIFPASVSFDCAEHASVVAFLSNLVAALGAADPIRGVRLASELTILSASSEGLSELAGKAWRVADRQPSVFIFENAEALASRPHVLDIVAQLLSGPHPTRHIVIASRVPLRLRTARFAAPHESRLVIAPELRFSREEIISAFGSWTTSHDIEEVERITNGWPVAVLLLRREAERVGELRLPMLSDGALGEYLNREIIEDLHPIVRDALRFFASVEYAGSRDLQMLCGGDDWESLSTTLQDLPLVSCANGRWSVNPLLKTLVLRGDPSGTRDVVRRIAARYEDEGDAVRAAELYLQIGDEAQGARLLGSNAALLRFPALWHATTLNRSLSVGQHELLAEAEIVWATIDAETSFSVLGGCFTSFASVHLNLGRFAAVHALCDEVDGRWPIESQIRGRQLTSVWRAAALAYECGDAPLENVERECGALLSSPATNAFWQSAVAARVYRSRGESNLEQERLDRALRANELGAFPVMEAVCYLEACFSAWLRGDDSRFAEMLDRLRSLTSTVVTPGTRFFVAAVQGRLADMVHDREIYVHRAYGYLMASALAYAEDSSEHAERFALAAQFAAKQSGQGTMQLLAWIARVEVGSANKEEAKAEFESLVRRAPRGRLRVAFERWLAGDDASPSALDTFVRRFRKPESRAVLVCLIGGTVMVGEITAPLAPREREIVAFLGSFGKLVERDFLLEEVFGSTDAGARNQLKVHISRIRAKLGPDVILTFGTTYGLGRAVRIDIDEIEALLLRPNEDFSRLRLARFSDAIHASIRPSWSWQLTDDARIVLAQVRCHLALAETALERGLHGEALQFVRRAVDADMLDVRSRKLLIDVYIAIGDRAAAERELALYGALLQRECQSPLPNELAGLFGTEMSALPS